MHVYVEKSACDFLAGIILCSVPLLCVTNVDSMQLCVGQNGWVCGNTFLWMVVESMYNRIHYLLLYFLLTCN